MALLETELDRQSLFLDKDWIRAIVAEQNAKIGFVPDPAATPQQAREMMRAQGVRPEDCLGSQDIIALRNAE